ncbi:hypothetical protein [Raoultibacter timonensis]|uniref:hypothetical protein n=1 Tax=Raoultibacter timonensis TaxID=1907662 RepID=UPI001FCAE0A9|nr:hypothetical protein [Raoultibacter timonensis]
MSIRTPAAVVPPVFYSGGGARLRIPYPVSRVRAASTCMRHRKAPVRHLEPSDCWIAGPSDCGIAGSPDRRIAGGDPWWFRKIPKIRPVLVEIFDSDPLKVRYGISDLRFCAGA